MLSYDSYYANHPLKKEALLLRKKLGEENAIRVLAKSKKCEHRRKVLSYIAHNSDKADFPEWINLLDIPAPTFRKLQSNIKKHDWRSSSLVKVFSTVYPAYPIVVEKGTIDDIFTCFNQIDNPFFKDANSQELINRILEKYTEEKHCQSNNVKENFKLQDSITYKNNKIIPMEFYPQFYDVGRTLRSCTGGLGHWNNVLERRALRFLIKRNDKIAGTILFQKHGEEIVVYGFERNYKNYSKETLKDVILKIVSTHPHLDYLLDSRIVSHGQTKGIFINL